MQLDAFRSVRKRLETSGNFLIFPIFSDDFDDFWLVFGLGGSLLRTFTYTGAYYYGGYLLGGCINWSTSELNTQVNPTTGLGDTGCWIQQVTAPTLVVTCWIHQCASILHSSWTGGPKHPSKLLDSPVYLILKLTN